MDAPANTPSSGYGTIVVPLDGSSLSESALPTAAALARESGATLDLVRVHVPILVGADVGLPLPDLDEELRRGERAHLEETARRVAREQGIATASHLLEGSVGRAIGEHVRTTGPGLVVITTHGRTGLSRMWLGSTADWLVRFVTVPVLLLRPREGATAASPFAPVLVALDGSERSERVLPDAVRLARLGGAGLTLLHVASPVAAAPAPIGSPTIAVPYDEARTRDAVRKAKDQMDAVAARLRRENVGLEVAADSVANERVADAILERAHETGAKVIALSTRGRGASRLLVGSVADKVLRGFNGMVLALGPAAVREMESDYLVVEEESTAGWT